MCSVVLEARKTACIRRSPEQGSSCGRGWEAGGESSSWGFTDSLPFTGAADHPQDQSPPCPVPASTYTLGVAFPPCDSGDTFKSQLMVTPGFIRELENVTDWLGGLFHTHSLPLPPGSLFFQVLSLKARRLP